MSMTPADYLTRYRKSVLTSLATRERQLDQVCRIAVNNQLLYQLVQVATNIPWAVVACIHFRESNQNFKCHLHNGDPLTARTVHEPVGRPETGSPPFSWSASAIDALSTQERPETWSIGPALAFMERYNGLGYQKLGVMTPYLWDFTSEYQTGLFTGDGVFDPGKEEVRPGCVAIMRRFEETGIDHGIPDEAPNESELH